MKRPVSSLLLSGCLLLAVPACSGPDTAPPEAEPALTGAEVAPAALVQETWQVRMSDDAARARFEADPGWSRYFARDLEGALAALGPEERVARARIHLEYAALYRQALMMYAHSAHFVYGERARETDPLEVAYLRGVSEYFRGEPEAARAALAGLPAEVDEGIRDRAEAWSAVLAGGAAWPPVLEAGAFPSPLPSVAPGKVPPLDGLPHYALAERVEGTEVRTDTADPTSLYLLSRWHEQAARESLGGGQELGPEQEALISQVMAPWRLPVEPAPAVELVAGVEDAWLFAGFATHPADLAFLADASVGGAAAVGRWSAKSPLAAVVASALEGDKVQPERLLEQAAAWEDQVEAAMEAKSGGPQSFHRFFAGMARLGALRAGAVVADASDQYRDAGLLRLNTMDASQGPLWDPVFVMSLAAWSAGNENTLRAQELAHQLIGRFPGVEAARYPLDALHIRRGRDSVQLSPVH